MPSHDSKEAVCADCMEDDFFTAYIKSNATIKHCDYCGQSSSVPISVDVYEIIDRISDGLASEYNDAADEPVPYESAEGGYQLPVMTTYELLDEVEFYAGNDELHDRIVSALPDYPWIRRDPMSLSKADALRYGWKDFCQSVKHRVRYLLFPPSDNDYMTDGIRPEEMLDALGNVVTEIELFSDLPSGTQLHRARIHEPGRRLETALDLGPPPSTKARFANRMSPSGVSMFYAAFDEQTALAETNVRQNKGGAEATIAIFELIEDVSVLDLRQIPEVPSLFDGEEVRWKRPGLIFLNDFLEDFVKPIEKDGREHIDYVPSQIVTEYFRYRFSAEKGITLRGIVYPSSQTDTGAACVLFVSNEDCADDWTFGEPMKPPFRLVSKHTRALN